MRTSYSALDTFQTCPKKYKFQHMDKLRSPKRVEQVFGTVVHSALKYMFEHNPLYPTFDEIVNFYTEKWNTAAEKILWERPESKEREEKVYFEEGLKILRNFFKKNSPWNFNAIELESRFDVEIEDEETGLTHALAGIIDRLDKDPNSDTYEIVDYKTGKKMPSQEMVEDNMQLGLYGLAVAARWPHIRPENITGSLYFLKHNDSVSTVFSEEKLKRVKRRILAIIQNIEKRIETGEFEPTPGPLCNWCGFRSICPMWSHEYKKDIDMDAPNEKAAMSAMDEFFEIKGIEERNKKRLAELRKIILDYMDDKKIDRVFGPRGYITRNISKRFSFDMEKVRPFLEKIGKWTNVLTPDAKKLEKLFPTLSSDEQEKINEAREEKSVTTLKQTKK